MHTAIVLAALDAERLGAETEGAAVALALGAKIVAAIEREARLRAALVERAGQLSEQGDPCAAELLALATTHVGSEGTDG